MTAVLLLCLIFNYKFMKKKSECLGIYHYRWQKIGKIMKLYYSGLPVLFQFVCYHVGATGTGEHEIAGRVVAAGAGANPRADQLAVYDE